MKTFTKNWIGYRGFTLVELLVVISIIALLLAIMMPALQGARNNAKKTVCASNLKQFGLGVCLYSMDNKDAIIPIQTGGLPVGTAKLWISYLAPYMGNQKGEKTLNEGGYWLQKDSQIEGVLKVFRCPSQLDPFYWNWYIRYGINSQHASWEERKLRMLSISNPSSRLLIADSMDNKLSYIKPDRTRDRLRGTGIYGAFGHILWPREHSGAPEIYLVSDRHNGGSNLLFLDGSTAWMKYGDIMFKDGEDRGIRTNKVKMWDYRELEAYYQQ